MTPLDLILLVILGLFILNGLRSGLIYMVGSLVGLFIGVALAGRWYEGFGAWLGAFVFMNPLFAQVVGFSLLLFLTNRLIGLGLVLVNKAFKLISIIPGMGSINRLAGAVLGLIEGILLISVILYFASKFDVGAGWKSTLAASTLVPILTGIAQIVTPLLPAALKSIQSILTKA